MSEITNKRPRKTRDRRLLEAIAREGIIMGGGTIGLPHKLVQQLLAIKESIQKGNK